MSEKSTPIKSVLIAPCGMNCRLCQAFIRKKNACPGCRQDDAGKPKTRVVCKIKTCDYIASGEIRYCSSCAGFPCANLRHLDKRYRTGYGMSMIENLDNIKRSGIRRFVAQEKERWACPKCGGTLCVHEAYCTYCGHKWR